MFDPYPKKQGNEFDKNLDWITDDMRKQASVTNALLWTQTARHVVNSYKPGLFDKFFSNLFNRK